MTEQRISKFPIEPEAKIKIKRFMLRAWMLNNGVKLRIFFTEACKIIQFFLNDDRPTSYKCSLFICQKFDKNYHLTIKTIDRYAFFIFWSERKHSITIWFAKPSFYRKVDFISKEKTSPHQILSWYSQSEAFILGSIWKCNWYFLIL